MKFINGIIIFFTVVLSGCSMEGTEGNDGIFHNLFVAPFSFTIDVIATLFNDNYGIAIIIITLAIRLLLLPIMIKQQKQHHIMKEKIEAIKPKINELQEKLKNAKDSVEQQKVQLEMMQFYKEQGINPLFDWLLTNFNPNANFNGLILRHFTIKRNCSPFLFMV